MILLFKYIKASSFLPEYCNIPYNSTIRAKWRGIYNGKEISFSKEEWERIMRGFDNLYEDMINQGGDILDKSVLFNKSRKELEAKVKEAEAALQKAKQKLDAIEAKKKTYSETRKDKRKIR